MHSMVQIIRCAWPIRSVELGPDGKGETYVKTTSEPIQIIKNRRGSFDINLQEFWLYREMLLFLTWKEITIRYRQTLLGALWAVIQPLFLAIIFTVIFGNIVKISSVDVPYLIFTYVGLILWTYFSNTLTYASMSLVSNANILSKAYFPRIMLPLSVCLVGLLDYAVAAILIFVFMIYFNIPPTPWLAFMIVPLFLTFLLASGVGFLLSAICVKYRDVRYATPFLIQMLFFVSPIFYPVKISEGWFGKVLLFNPLTGIMNAQRACIIGHTTVDWLSLFTATCITLILFIGGVLYFRKYDREFADVI
ncbi:MAG: ABC transporter permease [Thermoplasmatota archaeon]